MHVLRHSLIVPYFVELWLQYVKVETSACCISKAQHIKWRAQSTLQQPELFSALLNTL